MGRGTTEQAEQKGTEKAVGGQESAGLGAERSEKASENLPDLAPLNFLLGVMRDPAATPKQRIRAALVAARYKHVPVAPEKAAPVDEYGFSISRTLASEIKEDWLALGRLGVSSKSVPKHSEILARQAEREEFLSCPPGYSPERDLKRRAELLKKRRLGMREETELAFVIARITASEAAFNRSPEGRARRRIAVLKYRRDAANEERNRRVGLTRAEGRELDELLKQYPPKRPLGQRVIAIHDIIKSNPYSARS